jgi:hypothetical protein
MIARRHILKLCAGSLPLIVTTPIHAQRNHSRSRIAFRLQETAGLRRFGYPVHGTLPIEVAMPGWGFRLLQGENEIPAQFRPIEGSDRRQSVALDFTTSMSPFEVAEYSVEFGPTVKSTIQSTQGLTTEQRDGQFLISNPPHLTYRVPENLTGLVTSIATTTLDFLRADSLGLFIIRRGSPTKIPLKLDRGGRTESTGWTRRGPIAVGLRFEGTIPSANSQRSRTSVELTFVGSKSWIETCWSIEDAEDQIETIGVDLNLKVEGAPTLVDCGASTTVYSHLRKTESLIFTGNPRSPNMKRPRWLIEQGVGVDRKPYAVASPNSPIPEGWIHVMDRSRCSALAVKDFCKSTTDRFLVEATGHIAFERQFEPVPASSAARSPKRMTFWIHVVPMPVQVGAVTSAQSMLSPLKLEWLG